MKTTIPFVARVENREPAAGGVDGYEFQRLHGMGEVLYDALLAEVPGATCRTRCGETAPDS